MLRAKRSRAARVSDKSATDKSQDSLKFGKSGYGLGVKAPMLTGPEFRPRKFVRKLEAHGGFSVLSWVPGNAPELVLVRVCRCTLLN